MKKIALCALLSFSIGLMAFMTGKTKSSNPLPVREAIRKSLPLLQTSSHEFLENANGCHSCHHQSLGIISFTMAKERGFETDSAVTTEAVDSILSQWSIWKSEMVQANDPNGIVMTAGYDLWALSTVGCKPQKSIHLLIKNLLQRQQSDGTWIDPNPRPPLEYYAMSSTVLVLRVLQEFTPLALQNEMQWRNQLAKNWIVSWNATTNEERIYQILGMVWTKGSDTTIKRMAKDLIATQHADGGWSQLDSMPEDAYATGQALYALMESRVINAESKVYQSGISYLLHTQFPDGSWKVQSRALPVQPYVTTGFPHGENQFISAAGTNWAVMALLIGLEKTGGNYTTSIASP